MHLLRSHRWPLWPVVAGTALLGLVFFHLLSALLLVGAGLLGALALYRLRPLWAPKPPVPVHPEAFKALASAHGQGKAIAWPAAEGFALALEGNGATYLMQGRQGEVRTFKTLDAAARYASQMGFDRLEVRLKGRRLPHGIPPAR